MSGSQTNYPTIIELRSIEREILTLIKAYDKNHKTYLRQIKHKHFNDAKTTLAGLNQVNTILISLVTEAQSLLKKAISEGSLMQKEVSAAMPKMKATFTQAARQNKIIDRLNKDIINVAAEYDDSSLERNATYIEYYILFIGCIVIIIITVRSYFSKEANMVDNIILGIIIILIIYFFIKKIKK